MCLTHSHSDLEKLTVSVYTPRSPKYLLLPGDGLSVGFATQQCRARTGCRRLSEHTRVEKECPGPPVFISLEEVMFKDHSG